MVQKDPHRPRMVQKMIYDKIEEERRFVDSTTMRMTGKAEYKSTTVKILYNAD